MMQMQNKILSMVSLAKKAGKVSVGYNLCKERKDLKMIILAQDASDKTKKNAVWLAQIKKIALKECFDKELLGRHLGKGEIGMVGICDINFKNGIMKLFEKYETGGEGN